MAATRVLATACASHLDSIPMRGQNARSERHGQLRSSRTVGIPQPADQTCLETTQPLFRTKTCGLYYLESNIACRPYKRTVHHRDTGKISRVHQTYLHYHLEVSFKATRALPSRELPHPHAQFCDMRVLYFLLYIRIQQPHRDKCSITRDCEPATPIYIQQRIQNQHAFQ